MDTELEAYESNYLLEYASRLIVDNNAVIPDPLTLKQGWLPEKKCSEFYGMLQWPSVYYFDIANYMGISQPDFVKRLESDYKQGKCYRYYTCEFVQEVFFHPISEKSGYCLIKCKCTPSQRVNSKPYDVWAILTKNKVDVPGGCIKSAYCSCTASLGGTCNHIIGMLFRVERAIRYDVAAKPTCTSKPCTWNVPKGKVDTKPKEIKEPLFDKAHYVKDADSRSKALEGNKTFQDFSPSWPSKVQKLNNTSLVREELYPTLKEHIEGSCLWEMMESRSQKQERCETEANECSTLEQIADEYLANNSNLSVDSCTIEQLKEYSQSISFSDAQIEVVNKKTVVQSDSEIWFQHRNGRITASKFRRIYTRSKTLQTLDKTALIDASKAVLSEVMGYNNRVSTYATKHGISLEPHAKKKYSTLFKRKHKGIITNDTGLVICKDHPYM